MPGITKKTFQVDNSNSNSGSLAENPHVSAFLSPTSRIFTGGHGRPKLPTGGPHNTACEAAKVSASAAPAQFSVTGKQLTPDEVARKIASMLKPGPPFFSRVSNADLIDFISDASIMNCDQLRASAQEIHAKKQAQRAMAAFVPTGTVARRVADDSQKWVGVGTVWSSLEALPAGASWSQIPGTPSNDSGVSTSGSLEDDGLWNALTLSVDLDCTSVEVAKSVVVPTKVLEQNNFFNGNADSLFDKIGAGIKYKFDKLQSDIKKGSLKSNSSEKAAANYLSLSAYTNPDSFSATNFKLEWPSWMPWGNKKKTSSATPTPPTSTTPGSGTSGGQKRVWIPSSTKVSIHASWWGYNLYLPQPVMDSLEGDVDEAEKVANLINKCLTFMLNNIPAGLPTALGTVITILKAIAPTTGYISTFIGWSWDTIKSFNKGQGVVLSATWILPVALIPRAWDAPTAAPADSGSPAGSTPATPTTPAAPTTPTTPTVDPTAPTSGTTPATGGTPATVTDPSLTAPTTPATPAVAAQTRLRAQDTTATTPTAPVATPTTPTTPTTTTPTTPEVAAPGATLPPADPSTIPIDFSVPTDPNTSKSVYPGNALGRGGDQSTAAPMGDTPAPANQVPIDADS